MIVEEQSGGAENIGWPSREEMNAWLTANCGCGLPYEKATDLNSALHGVSYVLRQIESTSKYTVHIGQCGPATTGLRWLLDYVARHELAAPAQPLSGDTVRLVNAAREVAYGGHFDSGCEHAQARLRELDAASEAFASRIPWDEEPADAQGASHDQS